MCALRSTWQDADNFNQPLNFDTSVVTKMGQMFKVKIPPVHPLLRLQSSLPVHAGMPLHTNLPAPHFSLWTLGRERLRSTSR